jgi:septal ring factor EnvC (AmiA/AmiB activator)
MGRAIKVVFVLLLCSIAFVALHLKLKRPADAAAAPGRASLLDSRADGSVYAITLEFEKFDRRLMEEEKRSEKLQNDLTALRKDREDLENEVGDLQDEIRRLRRQVASTDRPPAANSPAAKPPVTPAPPGNGPAAPAPPQPGPPDGNL